MPPYAHLANTTVDFSAIGASMSALHTVGVPYTPVQIGSAREDAQTQARSIVANLREEGVTAREDSSLVALISYLQRLGVAQPEPLSPPRP